MVEGAVLLFFVHFLTVVDHGTYSVVHLAHTEILFEQGLLVSWLDIGQVKRQSLVFLLECLAEAKDFHVAQLLLEERL